MPENHNQYHAKSRLQTTWLLAGLLFILVLATAAVVGTSLYHYTHRSSCEISLYEGQVKSEAETAKNAVSMQKSDAVVKSLAVEYSGDEAKQQSERSAFEIKDNEQVWRTETAIDLFRSEYKNADGAVTVKSADGSKVIAPGTEGSYTFSLKNTSNLPADYKVWVKAELSSNMEGVPLQTRMSGGDGWLLGDRDRWEQAKDLNQVEAVATVDAGKTAEYTIYWQWPFEQGDDAADTDLANASAEQEMSYTVTIYTLTATAVDGNDGGSEEGPHSQIHFLYSVKTGDTVGIYFWMVVFVFALVVLGYGLLLFRERKNEEENERDKSEK